MENNMLKSTVFKILGSAVLVFLLLPAIYEEEEVQKPTLASQATEFNPSGYESSGENLPVLENVKQDNILVRYGKRFKKMYGKAFLSSREMDSSSQEQYANKADEEETDDDLFLAMSALLNSKDNKEQNLRSSYASGTVAPEDDLNVNAITYANNNSGYVAGSSAPIKQTMHDNAPVKGLYETSSVESYENRSKARQVYSNVMYKVEKNNPRPSIKKAIFAEDSVGEDISSEDYAQNIGASVRGPLTASSSRYSSFGRGSSSGDNDSSGFGDMEQELASTYKGFSGSKYVGIASPSSSGHRKGGGYSGFASSVPSIGAEDTSLDFNNNIEDVFAQAEADIKQASEELKKQEENAVNIEEKQPGEEIKPNPSEEEQVEKSEDDISSEEQKKEEEKKEEEEKKPHKRHLKPKDFVEYDASKYNQVETDCNKWPGGVTSFGGMDLLTEHSHYAVADEPCFSDYNRIGQNLKDKVIVEAGRIQDDKTGEVKVVLASDMSKNGQLGGIDVAKGALQSVGNRLLAGKEYLDDSDGFTVVSIPEYERLIEEADAVYTSSRGVAVTYSEKSIFMDISEFERGDMLPKVSQKIPTPLLVIPSSADQPTYKIATNQQQTARQDQEEKKKGIGAGLKRIWDKIF